MLKKVNHNLKKIIKSLYTIKFHSSIIRAIHYLIVSVLLLIIVLLFLFNIATYLFGLDIVFTFIIDIYYFIPAVISANIYELDNFIKVFLILIAITQVILFISHTLKVVKNYDKNKRNIIHIINLVLPKFFRYITIFFILYGLWKIREAISWETTLQEDISGWYKYPLISRLEITNTYLKSIIQVIMPFILIFSANFAWKVGKKSE